LWKIHKLVKEEADRKNVEELIKKYYGTLKKIFNYIASKSQYPTITSLDFFKFIEKS